MGEDGEVAHRRVFISGRGINEAADLQQLAEWVVHELLLALKAKLGTRGELCTTAGRRGPEGIEAGLEGAVPGGCGGRWLREGIRRRRCVLLHGRLHDCGRAQMQRRCSRVLCLLATAVICRGAATTTRCALCRQRTVAKIVGRGRTRSGGWSSANLTNERGHRNTR